MTQLELSQRTGIRLNTINDMYNEICFRVSLEHLDLICKELEIDLPDLLVRVPGDQVRPVRAAKKKPKIEN